MWLPTLTKVGNVNVFSSDNCFSLCTVNGTKTCVTTKNVPNASHLYCTSSDTTHHTTSTPPIPPPPMPPMEDGSNLDVDDEDDNDEFNSHARPDFMPDARDIMNKFPRPDAAALTKIRAFCETFGTSLLIVSKSWSMLWEEDLLPEGGRPKHLLWALHFLKVYPLS